jgi:hypothetical protein
MNKSIETCCVCHHPKSDHVKRGRNVRCKGLKSGVEIKQARAVSNDEMCDCKKYTE